MVHKICENLDHNICTFSIGKDADRRTVVCFKNQLNFDKHFRENKVSVGKEINTWRSTLESSSSISDQLTSLNFNFNKQMGVGDTTKDTFNTNPGKSYYKIIT